MTTTRLIVLFVLAAYEFAACSLAGESCSTGSNPPDGISSAPRSAYSTSASTARRVGHVLMQARPALGARIPAGLGPGDASP